MTTQQPYRGVTIFWYRIVADTITYAANWYWQGRWHSTDAYADLIDAITAAEARIDTQLASELREREHGGT